MPAALLTALSYANQTALPRTAEIVHGEPGTARKPKGAAMFGKAKKLSLWLAAIAGAAVGGAAVAGAATSHTSTTPSAPAAFGQAPPGLSNMPAHPRPTRTPRRPSPA
jgi:hypothetical protein